MSAASLLRAIWSIFWIFLRYFLTLAFWPFLQPNVHKKATAVYYNGDIITKSAAGHKKKAEAVVTNGEKIAFLGTTKEAREFVKAMTSSVTWIDLKGQTLSPGFIDPHLHPSMAAVLLSTEFITPFDWTFPWMKAKGVRSQEEYRSKLKGLQDKVPGNDWIITWGFHPLFHGKINRSILDSLCPDRPLVVWHRSFHELNLNSKAILECGVSKAVCESDPQVDWDEGRFFEKGLERLMAGKQLLLRLIPKLENGYDKVSKVIVEGGITTVADLEVP
jgi:predicted amidohydrolase YtcJ